MGNMRILSKIYWGLVISARKERTNSKLRNSKARLETEVDELEKKVERMNTMRTQV